MLWYTRTYAYCCLMPPDFVCVDLPRFWGLGTCVASLNEYVNIVESLIK
jgi:hypothetical protein